MSSPVIWGGNNTSKSLQNSISVNNLIEGYTTTATAAGTTTLTATSSYQQFFTGTSTQTVVMPAVSTLALGQQFLITNLSTGVVTVQSSGLNTIQAMQSSTQLLLTVISLSGTGTSSWSATYLPLGQVLAGISPTVQKFTSGSGTYTTPSGVQFIRVRMVGGGGGGGGSGTAGGSAGGTGGTTTFGTSLLTATGGTGGANNGSGAGGSGGTATVTAGPIVLLSLTGGSATGTYQIPATVAPSGASGACSPFGGAGGGGFGNSSAGTAAVANTGSGGGGAGGSSGVPNGAGGGAGGFIEVIIPSPSASYSTQIGAAGTAGTAGTSGNAGGAGGSGYIEVTEYYNNLAVGTTAAVSENQVLAGPSSGSAASPAFRSLVRADLPAFLGAKYKITTPSSPANGAAINYNTQVYDTNSAVTTGTSWVFTAPIAGYYDVEFTNQNSPGVADNLNLYKNAIADTVIGTINTTASTGGATTIHLAANDTIYIGSGSSGTATFSTSCTISISYKGA